jgi:1,4-alpha-glucan branching enzyme
VGAPAEAQVVETDPSPPVVDQSVTIFFNADEGTQGLADFEGAVYAHTGVFTDQSPSNWTCVKSRWPTDPNFQGNRPDTRLEQVDPNRYKLEIQNIRAYYNDNNTGCTLRADEEIQTMNFVFRSADGSQEGKGDNGSDIIVSVLQSGEVSVTITSPQPDPLTPFLTNASAVSVTAEAGVGSSSSLDSLFLQANGTTVASTDASSLTADVALGAPGAEATIVAKVTTTNGATARDTLNAIRNPDIVEQDRPGGIQDGVTVNASDPTTVTFSVLAPDKSFVYLIGDFTNWEVDPNYFMTRDPGTAQSGRDSTRYWITVDSLSPDTEYGFQYLVDGGLRMPDPFSAKVLSPNDRFISTRTFPNLKPYPDGETEQLVSTFTTSTSDFSFSSFDPPAQKDLVIYELLIRDFIANHDYATLRDTLDYLDRLGVNAVELMPVSEFDGNSSWGYNPSMHFATDKYYGPPEDLKQFIEEAHQRGIAVILDVVYNHATGQSPLIRLFNEGTFGPPTSDNPWANPEARHPFNVFNDMNHESTFTKAWLDRANQYWLEEFNVDGFRFDLSKGFTQGPDPDGYQDVGNWSSFDQERVNTLQRMADNIWSVDDDAYVILEHFADVQEERALTEYGTDQGKPGMMVWNNLNRQYNESSMGYINGEGFPEDLSDTYYENRGFTVPNVITYMESHDEQWLMFRNREFGNNANADEGYNVRNLATALERQKLVGAFFFPVPGPRMMWQFGELGYGFGEDGEQCLRDGSGDECPPGAPGRTAEKPIRWDYRNPDQSPNRVRLYKAWSAMINLRQQNDVFTSTDTEVSMRVGENQPDRRIVLEHPSMNAVVVGNFDVDTLEVTPNFPSDTNGDNTWYDFFTGEAFEVTPAIRNAPVTFAPGEYHIFLSEEPNGGFPEPGLTNFGPPGAPLPVELTDFSATRQGSDAVILNWRTATETNNAGFAVQRQVETGNDGASFRRIGFVEGAGTTSEPQRYRFTDRDLPFEADRVTYRLRQVDVDGTASLSSKVAVDLGVPQSLALHGTFPNPVRSTATLRYELPESGPVRIELYNVLGQQVAVLVDRQQSAGRKEIAVNTGELSPGSYFVRMQAPGGTRTERLTVVR